MYNEMDIDRIRGAVAYDQSGDRIGNVGEVYLDDQTGQPMWVTVNTGFFGLRTSFVPLEGSRFEGDDRLVLAHDKDRIKDAPNVDEDGHLDRAQEDELYPTTASAALPRWAPTSSAPAAGRTRACSATAVLPTTVRCPTVTVTNADRWARSRTGPTAPSATAAATWASTRTAATPPTTAT